MGSLGLEGIQLLSKFYAPVPESAWTTPINKDLFTIVSLKNGEKDRIVDPLDNLFKNGTFESTSRKQNSSVHPWMDNIAIPLKNKDGTPRLDDMGNPLQVKAPNPFIHSIRYFLTSKSEKGYHYHVQIVGLINDRDRNIVKTLPCSNSGLPLKMKRTKRITKLIMNS